jgi:hypothetical protein
MRTPRTSAAALIVGIALLATGCRAGLADSGSGLAAGSGTPVAEPSLDLERVRAMLLGDPPYPSGWEESVDATMEMLATAMEEMRVPDVTGLDEVAAACSTWRPLVGNTLWATGALLERHVFVSHVAALAQVAPVEIRPAAQEALAISAAGAAEQLKSSGDAAIVSRYPVEAVGTIGLWAVAHCDIEVVAEEAPDTEGWTAEEIAQSCTWDREWLEDAQEEYRAGAGNGLYAEHPHVLEVTVDTFPYPAWHRLARVDNGAEPPTFEVEPIPGSFCDV